MSTIAMARTVYTTKENKLAAWYESDLVRAIQMSRDGDSEAIIEMMNQELLFILQPGLQVFIEEYSRQTIIKIRKKGSLVEVWTLMDSVER